MADTPGHEEAVPEVYRRALDLREQGAGDEEIAVVLRVDPHAVPLLLELAEAKAAGG